jgi:hypothetical protein
VDLAPDFDAVRVRRARLWMPCLPLCLAGALVPLTGLRALAAPLWLAIIAAAALALGLPVLWHVLAERRRSADLPRPWPSLDRLALRGLAVTALLVAATLVSIGPRATGERLVSLFRKPEQRPAVRSGVTTVPPAGGAAKRHPLESFIPADASLVVAMSGAAIIRQALAAQEGPLARGADALGKCQILVENAAILIAARDARSHLVAVRAPGITDERNLYCLIGFLGAGPISLKVSGDKGALRFELGGLRSRPLRFQAVDAQTVVMVDEEWSSTAGQKLFAASGESTGVLAAVIARLDRGAALWVAGLRQGEGGQYDLALETRLEGTLFHVRASATPPSGEGDRADVEVRVPQAFAAGLPAGLLAGGARGLVTALTSGGPR